VTDPAQPQPTISNAGVLAPPASPLARDLFGPRLDLAERYVRLLAGDGVEHGHIGPREVPRLWERHLVNSALLAELIPADGSALDVGSGAGLPGLPVAIARPDLRVTLLEPMLRRSLFLSTCVAELGLGREVTVVRGRAEDPATVTGFARQQWIIARAVAPLDRLVKWCLPLLAPGGTLLAVKGSSAMDEVAQHRSVIERSGADGIDVARLGPDGDENSTWVVSVRRGNRGPNQRKAGRA
jgi:16S rRNA (guanine527-N7)-methyltransferase